jgi:N-acetylglucosaminyl-diphospho-decaprenol L-rhamnosyltransferase
VTPRIETAHERKVGDGAQQGFSLAVGVVSFNTSPHLEACLRSVLAEKPTSVVVVDNASSDGSPGVARSLDPGVHVIANTTNVGYGAAANQAIVRCGGANVLLLNGDTVVRPGALAALAAELAARPRAGVVGPRLRNEDGVVQDSCFPFPGPLQTMLATTALGRLVARLPRLGSRYRQAWSPSASEVVPWVLGAALAIRRDAFAAVGGFDETFFLYSEEVDLSYRLAAAGWETWFTPAAEVVHAGGASTAQAPTDTEPWRYAGTRRFYRKHYSRGAQRLLRVLTTYEMLRNVCFDGARVPLAREAGERARLRGRIVAWRRILREAWQE